jgi:hypothetical protein
MTDWTADQLDEQDLPTVTGKVDLELMPPHVREAIEKRRANVAARDGACSGPVIPGATGEPAQ